MGLISKISKFKIVGGQQPSIILFPKTIKDGVRFIHLFIIKRRKKYVASWVDQIDHQIDDACFYYYYYL